MGALSLNTEACTLDPQVEGMQAARMQSDASRAMVAVCNILVLRPASTSMSVVLPAPLLPTSAVRMPGLKLPLQWFNSCSMFLPSTTAAFGPSFSGSVDTPCNQSSYVSTKQKHRHTNHQTKPLTANLNVSGATDRCRAKPLGD